MAIRILHTSDWHLGKKLFKQERLAEQELFLKWTLTQIQAEQIDLLIISGDVFDIPAPPAKAYRLYHDFLHECSKSGVIVHIISGNHDGANFLDAPTQNLRGKSIFLHTSIDDVDSNVVTFEKGTESIGLMALPYFRLNELANLTEQRVDQVPDVLSALENLLKQYDERKKCQLNLLMAHHLFGSFQLAGSEMGLALSGIETLPLRLFKDQFDYLALGHIHNYQLLKKENPKAVYPGSPLPFRFGEKNQKFVEIVTIENNQLQSEKKEIPCFRELIQIDLHANSWQAELQSSIDQINPELPLKPLIEIVLHLDTPQSGLIDAIREELGQHELEFINLQCNYSSISKQSESQVELSGAKSIWNLSPDEMFKQFYLEQYPNKDSVPEGLLTEFKNLMNQEAMEDQSEV
jgi:exonuclease SbcD